MRPPAQKDVPNYLKKKNYGKVPSYLSENKRQIQREYDFIASIRNNTQVTEEHVTPCDHYRIGAVVRTNNATPYARALA